jgi:WD40 repeat protein
VLSVLLRSWVRCIAFDPSNDWFCTGSSDRTIKLWETGTGQLKLTLTGHIEQVTGLAVSPRHPYMFSCSLDKEVKCWDLEHNKVRVKGMKHSKQVVLGGGELAFDLQYIQAVGQTCSSRLCLWLLCISRSLDKVPGRQVDLHEQQELTGIG